MGFLDDLVGLAKSVGEANNEIKSIKKEVLSSFSSFAEDAKRVVDPTAQASSPSDDASLGDDTEPTTTD